MTDKTLAKILDFNSRPHTFIADNAMSDQELDMKILASHIKEDANGWWIEHNGQLICYCAKTAKDENIGDRQLQLKNTLMEVWGRYTNKQMTPIVDYGYRV